MTIKIASSQPESAIDANRHKSKLRQAACLAFEQWCRVAAGAGSADRALKAMAWFYEALSEAEESTTITAGDVRQTLIEALRSWEEGSSHLQSDEHERHLHTIVRGSLRKVASDMVGNLTQERNGRALIYDGILAIEKLRESNRKNRL